MTTHTNQLAQMEDVLTHNLKEACKDLSTWKHTGILPPMSIIRTAASRLTDPVFDGTQLVHAEHCVTELAMKYVIEHSV